MHTLLIGEDLCEFETLYAHIGNTTSTHSNQIIFVLGIYLFTIRFLYKQDNTMRHILRMPHKLKFRHYAVNTIKLNEYLTVLQVPNRATNLVRRK